MKKEYSTPSPWQYDETINTADYYGFVYLITNKITGRMYVGRKYLTASAGKRKPRKESDWKKYWGSCKELLADIKTLGEEHFERKILNFYKTRQEVNYGELKEQVLRDVLFARLPDGTRAFYNGNIALKYYAPKT